MVREPAAVIAAPTATVRAGRAMARLSRLLEQTADAAGLSLAQYRVLVFVRQEPCRASALADKVDVRRATLSALVSGLERDGLLARAAAAGDGRGVVLEVTAAGAAALAAVEDRLEARLGRAAEAGSVDLAGLAPQLEALLTGFLATKEADTP
jgi:DNA-binding MarR family transcriptional regulator